MEKKIDRDKENRNEKDDSKNKNKITEKHLNDLDEFIQKCLDNFKFVDPKQELYDATGEDKNIIISHKSTIPDLVIWNKTFNKNNCFVGANNNKETKFPRYLFYIKIKKSKKSKKNNKEDKKIDINKNIKNTNNNKSDVEYIEDNSNYNKNIINNIDNIYKNNINNVNLIYNNIKIPKYNKIEEKNKFSINQSNIIENNMNDINITINLVTYLIQLYLYKDGWIILTNDNFSGPGTSINLFQFLQEKIKENCNLDNFIIIDINKQVRFSGYNFYNLLSNTLNKILQKKQMELIKFEEIMNKQFKNDYHENNIKNIQDKMNNNLTMSQFAVNNNNKNNPNFNNNHININLYNNQIFPGLNYIGNINNNISNSNIIQNNITKYEYNIKQYPNNKSNKK